MTKPITVLIVGAGRFGANYVKVLSQIAAQRKPPLPPIGHLVVSRTAGPAAQALAAQIAAQAQCPIDKVTGVEISNIQQLEEVIDQHAPVLTFIKARDATIGDDIHAPYALTALNHSAVLCEKPFGQARGDSATLTTAARLTAHPQAARFGLELPMAVVAIAMAADAYLNSLLSQAGAIEFLWQRANQHAELINDLALHPWSLLPERDRLKIEAALAGRPLVGAVHTHRSQQFLEALQELKQ